MRAAAPCGRALTPVALYCRFTVTLDLRGLASVLTRSPSSSAGRNGCTDTVKGIELAATWGRGDTLELS